MLHIVNMENFHPILQSSSLPKRSTNLNTRGEGEFKY